MSTILQLSEHASMFCRDPRCAQCFQEEARRCRHGQPAGQGAQGGCEQALLPLEVHLLTRISQLLFRFHQVDFAHYKQVLKNQSVVSELEKTFTSFKPVDYDVQAQIKAIGQFQERAVRASCL